MKIIKIDGALFSNLEEFYDEIEKQFTSGLDWKPGRNLNAFNDLLKGGFGPFDFEEKIELIWINAQRSSLTLGYDETIKNLRKNLENGVPASNSYFQMELEMMENGTGKTIFETVIDIIKTNRHIKLSLQ